MERDFFSKLRTFALFPSSELGGSVVRTLPGMGNVPSETLAGGRELPWLQAVLSWGVRRSDEATVSIWLHWKVQAVPFKTSARRGGGRGGRCFPEAGDTAWCRGRQGEAPCRSTKPLQVPVCCTPEHKRLG